MPLKEIGALDDKITCTSANSFFYSGYSKAVFV